MATFTIDDGQKLKLSKWLETKQKKYTGAIGGRLSYIFHPTTLGVVVKVKDVVDNTEIDLTDYEGW